MDKRAEQNSASAALNYKPTSADARRTEPSRINPAKIVETARQEREQGRQPPTLSSGDPNVMAEAKMGQPKNGVAQARQLQFRNFLLVDDDDR